MNQPPITPPLPGRQYLPSNGTDGNDFLLHWCTNCARDKAMRDGDPIEDCDDEEVCQIIAASFRGEAVEWRELEDGRRICTAHVPSGQAVPPVRCPHTVDMFEHAPLVD